MEKFAVDLEKVLDEFEYNEEREENVSAPSIKNAPLPHLSIGALKQLPSARPPAASYRRPSFEPINLADADFAASPKSSTHNFSHGMSEKQSENNATYSYLGSKPQINNNIFLYSDDNIASLHNEVNINKQVIIESEETSSSNIWQNVGSTVTSDEKPDLLEYNSKNIDLDPNNLETHNQLPDITTSVRSSSHSVNNNEIDLSNSLDLISSASVNLLSENDEHSKYNKSESYERVDCNNLDKNIFLDSNLHNICNVLKEIVPSPCSNSDNTTYLNNDSYSLAPTIDDNPMQVDNSSEKQTKESVVEEDLSVCDQVELNKTVAEKYSEMQDHIGLSYEKSLEVSEEEKHEEKNTLPECIEKCDVQSDILLPNFEPLKFSTDIDISESELEEYLRELEVLENESLVTDKCNVPNNTPLELMDKTSIVECEENCEGTDSRVSSFQTSSTNVTNNSISGDVENCDGKKLADEDQCELSINETGDLPKKPVLLKSDQDQHFYMNNNSSSAFIDGPVKIEHKSLSSLPHTIEYKSENKIHTDILKSSTDNCENKQKECSGMEIQCTNQGEVSENNFKDSSNPFETAVIGLTIENEEIRPSNPFGKHDCSPVIEKTELKRKSTNPFENSDEEGASESPINSIPEEDSMDDLTPVVISKQTEASSGSNLDNVTPTENMELLLESTVPTNPSEELLNQPVINAKKEIKTSLSDLIEQNTNNVIPQNTIPGQNVSTECLPSCSSLYRESFDDSLNSTAKMIPIKNAIESPTVQHVDEAGIPAEEEKPLRPSSLELPRRITVEESTHHSPRSTGELVQELGPEDRRLGKIPPFWIPDTDTTMCMQCQIKFTVIKRRHHCRACGQVLCNKCCGLKARLEYMNFAEARVCQPCFTILEAMSASESAGAVRQPNPNNPMEYCSTIPPLQQAAGSIHQPPPSVMVPVGVLKREGRIKSDITKQVMFSDGIRPGGDLTELDGSGEPRMPFRRPGRLTKRVGTPPGGMTSPSMRRVLDPDTHSFIPAEGESSLPPVVSRLQGEVSYSDLESPINLNQTTLKFALNRNLFVLVKRILLDCCVNRECWCFSSEGLACVGQDEIVFLLECLPQETLPPKDVFILINFLYQEAAKGSTVGEMSFTPAISNNFLGSRDHGGFLYIRTSYQCTEQLVLPSPPYLVALLIHRWETPWARLFPIRLVLRLGAEFRYYPCPLVSVRNRPPLYTDIGHTIINILADFRKYSYTLPSVRGLIIHMEDRQTTINIPRNRYDQVVRALNNSNDSVLAFGADLSLAADSHLVCMQSTEDENTSYHTQAINIHNKPRRVTGASFVVFNGALKVPGLAGKSNIVEDGLMVQVPSETMVALRTALRDMRDYSINCGPIAEETVVLKWTADDTNFNIGVKSCIDGRPLSGVPSIRVHNGTDYSGGTRIIRWTEVFILQCEDSEHSSEPLDISRLSEAIARATCLALVPLLDLLSAASLTTLSVRATIHPDNVGYEAGSNGEKLPPLYMKSLDDELVAVVHQAALASQDNPAVLELIFRIMEQG